LFFVVVIVFLIVFIYCTYLGATITADTTGPCTCGEAWGELTHSNLTLHGLFASVHMKICERKCICGLFEWSGDNIAIHRFSRFTAFTYELHQSFFADLQDNQSPSVHTFWKRRMKRHLAVSTSPFVTVDTYQSAIWSLCDALALDFKREYTCDWCGNFMTAPILIFDGKALVCKPGDLFETEQKAG